MTENKKDTLKNKEKDIDNCERCLEKLKAYYNTPYGYFCLDCWEKYQAKCKRINTD
jgi:hypothetical protein